MDLTTLFEDIAQKTGFNLLMIEKDYYLSLILSKFGERNLPDIVFKGGTCLNKVYLEYFRLSEDLDFVYNFPKGSNITRSQRSKLFKELRNYFIDIAKPLGLRIDEEEQFLFNESKQLSFVLYYNSIYGGVESIKIEVSYRFPLEVMPVALPIKHFFKDPFTNQEMFQTGNIYCIDFQEAVAEKIRASLTRKDTAIRDFFDIRYIKNLSNFDFLTVEELVQLKLAEENFAYTLNDQSYESLQQQITSRLNPVISKDYGFSLKEIYDFILSFKK